jgi:hypothetical protein
MARDSVTADMHPLVDDHQSEIQQLLLLMAIING